MSFKQPAKISRGVSRRGIGFNQVTGLIMKRQRLCSNSMLPKDKYSTTSFEVQEITPREQSKRQSRVLDQFCDFTAMEGFRFLHSRNAIASRMVAIMVMMVCVSLFGFQTIDRLSNHFRQPVVINSELLEEKQMTFPNLILCDESQYQVITKDTVSPEFGLLIRRILTESRAIPEVDRLPSVFDRLKKATATLTDAIDFNQSDTTAVFDELERLGKEIVSILPETGRLLMMRNINFFLDLIGDNVSKTVNFEQFKNSQLLWDSCMRIQTLGRDKRAIFGTTKVLQKVSSTLDTALCRTRKAEDTINQILHMDLSSYLLSLEHNQQDLIIKCSWLNLPCKIDKVWTTRGTCFQISSPNSKVASSRVVGQSSAIHLLIDTFAFEGNPTVNLFLRPSTMKEFSLTSGDLQLQPGSREKFAINQVIKIFRHQTRCGELAAPPGFSAYVQGVCQWDHKQLAIQTLCNCSWFFGTTKPSERSINETKACCNFTQHHGCASFIEHAISLIENSLLSLLAEDDCPRDCEAEQYEIDRVSSPLLTNAYVSSLPSDWTVRTKKKLDKFVKQARRTGLTSYASGLLIHSIDDFFAFHVKFIRFFYMKHQTDHEGRMQYSTVKIPLRFLHEEESEDNLLGMERLSTYLSQETSPPCKIDQLQFYNETEKENRNILLCSRSTEHRELMLATWSKPVNTYQKWLRTEIFAHRDCFNDDVCSVDRYSDDVNMATSIVMNASSSNIADFARYYSVARNMNRLRKMIDHIVVQLNEALTVINEADVKYSEWSKNNNLHSGILQDDGDVEAKADTVQACFKDKKNMISALLSSSVLTSSSSKESKSLWFAEFEDLIQLDESKVYLPGRTYDKSNLVEVTVFFRSLTKQTITQTSLCTIWMLLSEIGGTMGMYLGATVVTGYELILFAYNVRHKKNDKFETRRAAIYRRRLSAI